jgi:alpha-L-fucosidase
VPALIHYLVRAAGSNANFLLNIGPMPTGQVQPEFVERLHAIGQWTEKYGDTIYGTRGGPITPRSWGVSTQKAGKTYLHILDLADEYLALPALPGIKQAHLFGTNAKLELKALDGGLLLRIPKDARDPIDTIVVLE